MNMLQRKYSKETVIVFLNNFDLTDFDLNATRGNH